MDEAVLALQGVVTVLLVVLIRQLWRMNERLARLEGRRR